MFYYSYLLSGSLSAHRVLTTVAYVTARERNAVVVAHREARGDAWPPLRLRRTDFAQLSRLWPSNSRVPTGPKKRKEKRNGATPIAALHVVESRN